MDADQIFQRKLYGFHLKDFFHWFWREISNKNLSLVGPDLKKLQTILKSNYHFQWRNLEGSFNHE